MLKAKSLTPIEKYAQDVRMGHVDLKRPPLPLFSIYDSKANAFAPPFVAANNALAIRMFGQEARQASSNLAKFSEDYSLHHVGFFDESNGSLASVPPTEISRARNFTEAPPELG